MNSLCILTQCGCEHVIIFLILSAFAHIFETTSIKEGIKYLIHAAYLEIYNEEIRDLLGKDAKAKLDLKEHPEKGVYVSGKFEKSTFMMYYKLAKVPPCVKCS